MRLSPGPYSSRGFLAIFVFAGFLYSYLCWRGFRASELAASGEIERVIQAAQLESQNAGYWTELGKIRLYRENDAHASLAAFRRAAVLNPRDADAWIGAAFALQVLDQPTEEHDAIAHALAAEPRRLEIVWQAANLYSVLGDRGSMMKEVCVLLAHDHSRAAEALELARHSSLRASGNVPDCSVVEAAR